MARVTHVKSAQQRYETVPVIDPATGEQKRTPMMKKVRDRETGEVTQVQKTTKTGRPVFLRITQEDRSKPKPPYKCDYPSCPHPDRIIEVGTPYKHMSPKSGPYGGRKLTRHESCPTWQVWEYSSSLSARLAQISHDFWSELDGVESTDDVQSALDAAAEEIKGIAEEKREGASNIEDGFGHPTSASEELEQTADSLDEWADEVAGADIPDIEDCTECDGTSEVECPACEGSGEIEAEAGEGLTPCEDCEGTGKIDCEAGCVEGQDIDGWRENLQDSLSIIDESPV